MPKTGNGPIFIYRQENGDDKSAGTQAAIDEQSQEQGAGARGFSSETRCLHAGLHDDAEETQLGDAQGGPSPVDERFRGNELYRR